MSGKDKLSSWFGLSYSSFATLPRVFMEAMPDEWQGKFADLMNEWDETWNWGKQDEVDGTRVQIVKNKKLSKVPDWIINYRHPDYDFIDNLKYKNMV